MNNRFKAALTGIALAAGLGVASVAATTPAYAFRHGGGGGFHGGGFHGGGFHGGGGWRGGGWRGGYHGGGWGGGYYRGGYYGGPYYGYGYGYGCNPLFAIVSGACWY